MVSDETGRREFLLGAAGLSASGGGSVASARSNPAVVVPGLDADHGVRWTFEAGDDGIVHPGARAHGLLFTTIRSNTADGAGYEAVALDLQSGAIRWRVGFDGWSIPQAANGLVYVAGHERLVALDPNDGNVRWRFEREPYDPPGYVVDGQSIFVVGGARVAAIDATEGGTRWTTEVSTNDLLRTPLSDDERVYLGGGRGFYALDREDGRERWFAEVPVEQSVVPVAARDGLLVGWSDRAVYGVSTDDGTRKWRTEVENLRAYGSVGTVTDDAVYVCGERLTAVDLRTGERRWTYDSDPGRGHGVRAVGGRLFFAADESTFVALDADSGRETWRFDAGRSHEYWGGVADGRAYVVGEHRLHVLDVESGRETWSLDLGDETGLWADVLGGLVIVGTRGGTLYAVDRPSPLATAPVATVERFATSPPGLGLLGLLGAGTLAAGYRRRSTRRADDGDPDLSFGRLDRLGGGPVAETYRKRVRTPDGPRLVAETRLTAHSDTDPHADSDADFDPEIRRAFERAIDRWADLAAVTDRSPASDGVLPILDSGIDPAPWFETPYATGGSLADAWPVSRRERVEVASGVARALHAAHREGVVHHRLAPRHVFLDASGDGSDRVLVGGWFLADALADARDAPDPYAPPERDPAGDSDSTVRGDVYCVGALAHHLLYGAIPDPSADALGATDSPAGERSDDPAAVISRALAADPADRYDSALAFDDAFRWAALDR